MKRAEENLILGIGIGYLLCRMTQRTAAPVQPTPPVKDAPPVVFRIPSRKNPLPSIGRRPWPMQNPLMYMAY